MEAFETDPIIPNNPLLGVLIGKSGSGKTTFAYKLLTSGLIKYDNLYICAGRPNIKYYKLLFYGFRNKIKPNILYKTLDVYNQFEKEGTYTLDNIKMLMEGLARDTSTIEDREADKIPNIYIPPTLKYEDLLKHSKLQQHTIVLVDDYKLMDDQILFEKIFVHGRGDRIGCIYLTPDWVALPKDLKDNASFVAGFNLNGNDILNIWNKFRTGMNFKEFKSYCDKVFNKNNKDHIYLNPTLETESKIRTNIFERFDDAPEEKDPFEK